MTSRMLPIACEWAREESSCGEGMESTARAASVRRVCGHRGVEDETLEADAEAGVLLSAVAAEVEVGLVVLLVEPQLLPRASEGVAEAGSGGGESERRASMRWSSTSRRSSLWLPPTISPTRGKSTSIAATLPRRRRR